MIGYLKNDLRFAFLIAVFSVIVSQTFLHAEPGISDNVPNNDKIGSVESTGSEDIDIKINLNKKDVEKTSTSHDLAKAAQSDVFKVDEHLVFIKANRIKENISNPYEKKDVFIQFATGVLVNGKILTDIDSVRDSLSVYVQPPGYDSFLEAKIVYLGFDCGLAMLEIIDKPPNLNLKSITLGSSVPDTRDDYDIYGFKDNKTIHFYKTRIESVEYANIDNSDVDKHKLIFFQNISSDRKTFYNGSPIIKNGELYGIFHSGKNMYAISNITIKKFLNDVSDNRYDGFKMADFSSQPLLNPFHKNAYNITGSGGASIVRRKYFAKENESGLIEGDVILAVDDINLTGNGKLNVNGFIEEIDEYISYNSSEMISFKIFRYNSIKSITSRFANKKSFKRKSSLSERKHLMAAGLIFQSLDYTLYYDMAASISPINKYFYEYFENDKLDEQFNEVIVLTDFFNDPINEGANKYLWHPVESLNGRKVRGLSDFQKEWNSTQNDYISIKFYNILMPLIISGKEREAANQRIFKKYDIYNNINAN